MDEVKVNIVTLPHNKELGLPLYVTSLSAGLDLMAAIADSITLEPLARALVPTGCAIALPLGFEAQVRPRSGLAWKRGLTVLNSPGTIDADYRGEIQVLLINFGNEPVTIYRGDRIAQLIVTRVARVSWVESTNLDETSRGQGGIGSTGTNGRLSGG